MPGHARSADFKSQPEGESERSYLVEWTSLSYTPLTEFRLDFRREGGQWQEIPVQPSQAGGSNFQPIGGNIWGSQRE